VLAVVKSETRDLKKTFGDPRRTVIYDEEVAGHTLEEFIPNEGMVVTLSQRGYIKRMPIDAYRTQHRGGKGVRGMATREDDAVMSNVVASTHDTLFFFTNRGRVYPLRVFQITGNSSRATRGTPLVNLLPLSRGEQVQTMLSIQNPREDYLLVLATRLGEVKALKTGELANIRPGGLIVMDLAPGDELVSVAQVGEAKDIIMVSEAGQAIRFAVSNLTPHSRTAGGVRGMRLQPGDQVVAMAPIPINSHLLIVSQRGYGKSTPLSRYPRYARGGLGVRTFKVTPKTGPVAAARVVVDGPGQRIIIISAKAQEIQITLEDFRVTGRNTQGVIVWRDREPDDYVVSVACYHEPNHLKTSPSSNGHRPANGNGPEA
jgi:DNA gyrase subunit A